MGGLGSIPHSEILISRREKTLRRVGSGEIAWEGWRTLAQDTGNISRMDKTESTRLRSDFRPQQDPVVTTLRALRVLF